ncbi:MAG: radical SAM protein [Patescibacteria group bacterium]|nr:radical SAM protein [Patescibacteria group bacterium]
MKIALIFPPSLYQTKQTMPPLGIAWIAAVLRENGYKDVYLIDSVINNYSNKQVIEILKKKGADVIGVSFGTQNRFYAFDLIREIKKEFTDIPLITGGPHPTLTADDMLKKIPQIDIVIRGEGEYTFLDLVKTIDKNNSFDNVKGISYRRGESIIHNSPREPIMDLDSLPFPARDLLPINDYKQTIPLSDKICTSMLTSRGCPFSCIYCSTAEQWGHAIRHRSPDNIIQEIKYLMANYKLDGVGFFDDVFTINKQRVIEFCQKLINSNMEVAWWCEARANTIDREVVSWMKRAGCEHISMAIESGNNQILKNIKKAITVEQGIKAVKIIKQSGIKLKTFFMYSLPGETKKEIKQTVELIKYFQDKLGVDEVAQSITMIYPGTEIERIAKEKGIIDKNFSWSEYFEEKRSYPPLESCKYIPIYEEKLSYEEVFKAVKHAKLLYYLKHPAKILRNAYRFRRSFFKWLMPNKT